MLSKKMSLLILTNNPDRPSFRQRIGIYVDTLRSAGIECEVAKLPTSRIKRFELFKRAANFNGVLLHKKCLNFFDAICLRTYSRKIIYDFDDAIMYSTQTPDSDRTSHFRLFRRTAKLADMIIAGNQYLAEYAKRFNDNVRILPTGLNINEYNVKDLPKIDGKIRLVWIGSKSTLKYLLGIKEVLEEVGARFPNVVLRIICDDFFDLENMEVEKFHWSLARQAQDLFTSHIGLAPLPSNRFTRGKCGFKALQYAAAELPVIASPVGVNTEYIVDEVTGYHAFRHQQWVDRICECVKDENLRKKLGAAAKGTIERFDSDLIGKKLGGMIANFLEGAAEDMVTTETKPVLPALALRCDNPKVSICIPTYNRKDYLQETLESVLAQTYKNYEIVIVDDGSTDGTEEMIKNLGYPVTYHWQENAGDAAARNKLIELAKGEYISFIDSDDLLMPDSIEKMVNVMESEAEDAIVYGSYFRIDQAGNIYGKCKRKLYSGNITKYLFETILIHACGSMFPKKILKGPKVFDTSLKVCSDYDLWLNLSTKYHFVALSEPTFKRRRHNDNLSVPSFENCLTELKVLEKFYSENAEKNLIPERIVRRVFSKENRRVGRCATREGLHDQAVQFLSQSFRQHPNPKSLISWIRAMVAKRMAS